MSEQEALRESAIDQVCEHLDPQGYGWASGDGPTMEEVVGALVALGWRPAPGPTEKARLHLAWLMWCYQEGYIEAEDREILTNWMGDDPETLHPDDLRTRDGLLGMAGEMLALLGAPQTADAPEGHGDADEAGERL